MSYRLVKSDTGSLKAVDISTPTDVALLPMPTKDEHDLECAEGVLAELYKLLQHEVEKLEVLDPSEVPSCFDKCDLVERMAKVECLLKEECVVLSDTLNLAHDILEQYQDVDECSLKDFYSKISELLHKVRPVDLDLLLQLLLAGKQAGDTMVGKEVLLFIGQTG